MRAFPRRNTSPVEWVAHHNAHPPIRDAAKSHFFSHARTPRARASSDHSRILVVAVVVVAIRAIRYKKKETYRNYQTPLDRPRGRPRGRPPVCSSGAAARIRSPSAPPGRSRRWMTPVPVPVSASVPVPLPVRSTGVNPRNHPPSWTCSLHFVVVVVVVVVGRARRTPRSSRVACWRRRVGSRPVDGWMDFNRCTL